MRHWKLFVGALVAVGALGALMAVTAFALPTILPETIKTFTGKNIGNTALKVVGAPAIETVVCTEATGLEGTIEQPKPLGLYHIHFKKCTAGSGFLTCTGLGEESGVILSLGSWHLVYDTLGASLSAAGVAILFLVATVHFECGGKLLIVAAGGMVLCLITNPAALTKVFTFNCQERTGGGPFETKYYNEAGTLTSIVGLTTSENEGTTKESVQIGKGTIETGEAALIMT
jgi:hypothetical protein